MGVLPRVAPDLAPAGDLVQDHVKSAVHRPVVGHVDALEAGREPLHHGVPVVVHHGVVARAELALALRVGLHPLLDLLALLEEDRRQPEASVDAQEVLFVVPRGRIGRRPGAGSLDLPAPVLGHVLVPRPLDEDELRAVGALDALDRAVRDFLLTARELVRRLGVLGERGLQAPLHLAPHASERRPDGAVLGHVEVGVVLGPCGLAAGEFRDSLLHSSSQPCHLLRAWKKYSGP